MKGYNCFAKLLEMPSSVLPTRTLTEIHRKSITNVNFLSFLFIQLLNEMLLLFLLVLSTNDFLFFCNCLKKLNYTKVHSEIYNW